MRFAFGTAAFCLLSSISATFGAAIDEPDTTPWLQARALTINNAPTENIYCVDAQGNWVEISAATITGSIQTATDLTNAGKNNDGYPSPIYNPQSLQGMPAGVTSCSHYPIAETMSGTKVFTGSNFAENIRVMYTYTADSSTATFLGVWTHAGATSGQYIWCGTTAQWGYKG